MGKFNLTFRQILVIIAVLIGGIFSIINPDKYSEAMDHTILAVILIALFTNVE